MSRPPPRSTRANTRRHCTTLFRSDGLCGQHLLTRTLPWAMTAIALGGAAFLIWLGCKALSAHVAPATVDAPPVAAASWQRNFATGLATNVLNPKRSEEHTSELQSLMRISYAVFCLKKKKKYKQSKSLLIKRT